jgi:hypothetical protein
MAEHLLDRKVGFRNESGTTSAAPADTGAYTIPDGRNTTGLRPVDSPVSGRSRVGTFVWMTLAVWLGVVAFLGARGAFVVPAGTVPYPIALGFAVPLVVFLAAAWLSSEFRNFVTSADLRLVTAIQAWRWAGFGFISLYVYNVLPGAFAWPAGLGDMAIGLTAPWVTLALVRRPSFARSRLFVIWNLLGILDLVAAVGNGGLSQLAATGAAGEITTTPMAQLPMLLIPAFGVPLFLMLHLTGLFQAWRLSHADND